MSTEPILGAILAGGESRRMGKPKAGVQLPDGRTMAEAVRDALAPHTASVVVLGHGSGCPDDLERVPDAEGVKGPVAGLITLLRSGRAQRYVLASCDMPGLTPPLVERLVAAAGEARAVVLERPGSTRLQPLPLLVDAAARDDVERLVQDGERRFLKVVSALSPANVSLTQDEADALVDINLPSDLPQPSQEHA